LYNDASALFEWSELVLAKTNRNYNWVYKSSYLLYCTPMSLISVVTPCYNEADNVIELVQRIRDVFSKIPDCTYEHILIDNASTDNTVEILRDLAKTDKNVKVIVNNRNYGHIRSPVHGLLQAHGEAIILLASDLQDPPELILEFVDNWKRGFKVVMAVKNQSEESFLFYNIRKFYYDSLARIADVKLVKNYTGSGLYDRSVIEILRKIDDPYPYFRGLISELGFESKIVNFKQPTRKRGFTKNNFYTLYDIGMLGVVNYSRVPLRLATIFGFILSIFSLIVSLVYLVLKILYWQNYSLGMASLLIGFFFLTSVQLFFIGIIGEYVGTILTQVQNRPLAIEKERINF
jgi:glycosyltransferase involved in cell wall biosynthesis